MSDPLESPKPRDKWDETVVAGCCRVLMNSGRIQIFRGYRHG